MSSRRILPLLVCPFAPFLIPRSSRLLLARLNPQFTFTPLANCYSTPSKRPSTFLQRLKKQRKLVKRQARHIRPENDGQLELVEQYRGALTDGELGEVMQLYPDMMESSLLRPIDTLETARFVHTFHRRATDKTAILPQLLTFADVLIEDLRERKLPPHTAASLHLLSFFKEAKEFDKGLGFWEWLVLQNEDFVDAAVYGAAIEMLAYQGSVTLQELENMYMEALCRFPGSFAEYHLSPEAVVLDRGQPTVISGLPMSLLQGIMTARILHGDWKNAYLGLDTALRLFPTQVPPRMFELFILERPLSEGYTSFLLACRSGVVLKPDRLTALLDRLAAAQSQLPMSAQFQVLEGMVNAMHVYVGAGGQVLGPHVGVLVKGLENVLPERPSKSSNLETNKADDLIVAFAEQVPALFEQAGMTAIIPSLGSLVGIAGKAKRPEMVTAILEAISKHGSGTSPILYRRALLAAGQMGNQELIKDVWGFIVRDAEAKGDALDVKDWLELARAARRSDMKSFVEQQASELRHTVTEDTLGRVQRALASSKRETQGNGEPLDHTVVDLHLQQLLGRIALLIELIKSERMLDFHAEPIPLAIVHRPPLGPDDSLREIYDELSTDPNQPPPTEGTLKPAVSSTGFPYDELRFENWKIINELLAEAELHEAAKQKSVADAMKSGIPLQKQKLSDDLSLCFRSQSEERTDPKSSGIAVDQAEDLQAIRNRILRLRDMREAPVHS